MILIKFILYTFLKLAGAIICSLLLWHEIDINNSILRKICTISNKTNCSYVLNSSYAKILGFLTWSEIGFCYFLGGFFLILFNPNKSDSLIIIGWLSIITFPYIFYSVYYQWRVVKQWCILCLSVQMLLLLEFILSIVNFNPVTHKLTLSVLITIVSFGIPAVAWYLLKPFFVNAYKYKSQYKELNQFKYNSEVFKFLLHQQNNIDSTKVAGLGITIGNPNAPNTIIKVCSPYCGPCGKAHLEIEKLISQNSSVKVQIIFTASNNNFAEKNRPINHLLAIAKMGNGLLLEEALGYWYSSQKRDYVSLAEKFPVNDALLNAQKVNSSLMSNWCNEVEIRFTPTFFINGFQLSDAYHVTDLKHILA